MNPRLAFQEFQSAFACRLRDPRRAPAPAGVSRRRLRAYEELLFNNLCGFLDACFPLCRQLLGELRWQRLNRAFYREGPARTPWFREIPRDFVLWLQTSAGLPRLPRWLPALAHYEWVELALDVEATPLPAHNPDGDPLTGVPVLNPALFVLYYDWPVQRIGPDCRPRKMQPTWLLAWRDASLRVNFAASNALTAAVLLRLGACSNLAAGDESAMPESCTGGELLRELAAAAGEEEARWRAHGAELFASLRRQGILLGSRR